MLYLLFAMILCVVASCSRDDSPSAPHYDSSTVDTEIDENHEGLVRIHSAGHYTYLGTNKPDGNLKEKPSMKVEFDYDFSIAEHELTQEEYAKVMGGVPESGQEKLPIVNVTFGDVVIYVNQRSKQEGYDTVYTFSSIDYDELHHVVGLENFTFNPEVEGYRLPTEAEWIFAASRGWNVTNGWNESNSGNEAHIVCSKEKNELGLCDMAGNVAEWVNDWLGYFKDTLVTNYVGAPYGGSLGERVLKGGSFKHSKSRTTLYSRLDTYTVITSTMSNYVGSRIAFGKIENPVWMSADGQISSKLLKSVINASDLKKKLGSLRAKLAFVNGNTNQLVYVAYNEGSFTVREIQDSLLTVKHPDISPDGQWVAFCTGEEGLRVESQVYVRRLNAAGTDLVKLDVESAAIPRFRVTEEGDTVIVYVSSANNNKEDETFRQTSTWQVPFSNGKFGKPQKLFDGGYHGGVSSDNRLAVTGARLLRARIPKNHSDILSEAVDTVWYNGEQACNVSLSEDGSKRTLFLDFASETGRTFVGKSYYVHERLLIADSTGKLIQSVAAPSGKSFDHTEWVNGRNMAVASIADENGNHSGLVLIDLNDSSVTNLITGDEVTFPSLRVVDVNLPESEEFLDLDSAGAYMTASSNVTTRIMKVKMEYFWQYRDVAEIAVIGSSRSFSGVDPAEIQSYFTLNFAYSAEDMTATEYFVNNYFLPLMPKLKAVVVTLDYDRWNTQDENWNSWFGNIPGYKYDENHSFWSEGVPQSMWTLTKNAMSPDEDESFVFGYHLGLYHSSSEGWGSDDPEVSGDIKWYSKNKKSYDYNRSKLVSILEAAKAKGILVIGAVFPQSPYYVKKGAWGRYGLTLDDAKKIQEDISSLEKVYDNFYIMDEYHDGENDYEEEDFSNEDHLGLKGAAKFAQRLDSLLQKKLK